MDVPDCIRQAVGSANPFDALEDEDYRSSATDWVACQRHDNNRNDAVRLTQPTDYA
jgi:hypothetical protein